MKGAVEGVVREFARRERLSRLGGDFASEEMHGLGFIKIA